MIRTKLNKTTKWSTLLMESVLMNYFDFRTKYIVPNVSFGAGLHECDLLVITKTGYATEVEIKVSLSDLKNDCNKKHQHKSKKIKELWFAIPEIINPSIALEYIPERAGLLWVYGHYDKRNPIRVKIIRPPITQKLAYKWTEKEIFNVLRLAAMRIYSLKNKLLRTA